MEGTLIRRFKHLIKPRKVNRSFAGNLAILILLLILGSFMILPLLYVVMNAFKPINELFLFPPRFFVKNPTIQNFIDLQVITDTTWVPFTRYFFNTVYLTLLGTIGHIFFASMAAYVLAIHTFPGSKFIFKMIVLSLMFSATVTQVPNYLTNAQLGTLDTYWSILLPVISSSLGLYLLKQFMEQIPFSLIEAARIDGAGEFKTYWRIVMPNVKPAILTLVILQIQGLWNVSSGYIYSEQKKPLTQALNQLIHKGSLATAGVASAVGLLLLIVPITAFILSQAKIIETMSTSGMKD